MFQILPCPSCQTFLKLPTEWQSSRAEVELRCPTCAAEISLKDLVTDAFPTWELISSREIAFDNVSSSDSKNTASLVSDDIASSAQYQPALPTDGDDLELVSASESATAAKQPKKQIDWSSFEPITHEQFERMKRKQKSPIWSMLQVVLGGFMAIPIALLILWHGLGRDVGDAGPTVAKYVPWIVPKKFQGRSASNTRPRPVEDGNRIDSSDTIAESSSPTGTEFDSGGENEVVNRDSTDPVANDGEPNLSMLNEDSLSAESINETDASVESDPLRLDLPPIDLRTENVLRMIRECEKNLKLWNESTLEPIEGQSTPPTEIRELAQRCYSQLQALTNTITPIPKAQPYLQTIRTEMGGIGRAVKNMESVQQLVQKGSQYWLSKSTDGGVYPLAIIVEVERVEFAEGTWRAVAKGEMSVLDIQVSRSLSPYMSEGQRLFMMGNVSRPAIQVTTPASDQKPVEDTSATGTIEPSKPIKFVAEYLHAM